MYIVYIFIIIYGLGLIHQEQDEEWVSLGQCTHRAVMESPKCFSYPLTIHLIYAMHVNDLSFMELHKKVAAVAAQENSHPDTHSIQSSILGTIVGKWCEMWENNKEVVKKKESRETFHFDVIYLYSHMYTYTNRYTSTIRNFFTFFAFFLLFFFLLYDLNDSVLNTRLMNHVHYIERCTLN